MDTRTPGQQGLTVSALGLGTMTMTMTMTLAWLLAQDPHVVPISGTRSITRLAENVSAAGTHLTEQDLAQIAAVLPHGAYGERYPAVLTEAWASA